MVLIKESESEPALDDEAVGGLLQRWMLRFVELSRTELS